MKRRKQSLWSLFL